MWSRFRVHITEKISWTGAPPFRQETCFSLSRQFQEDLWVRKWQVRQGGVLACRPRETQQDFILFHLLQVLGSGSLRDKIFHSLPIADNETLCTRSLSIEVSVRFSLPL